MTAYVEQIMATVTTLCTGLTTTGANVERDRIYFVDEDIASSLSIVQGVDVPVDPEDDQAVWQAIDWELQVVIEIRVKRTSAPGTAINLIRNEVHAALMADYTLGLSFVHAITPGPAEVPEMSPDLEQQAMGYDLSYLVRYRTSRTDLSA